jgi:hypothetical protein
MRTARPSAKNRSSVRCEFRLESTACFRYVVRRERIEILVAQLAPRFAREARASPPRSRRTPAIFFSAGRSFAGCPPSVPTRCAAGRRFFSASAARFLPGANRRPPRPSPARRTAHVFFDRGQHLAAVVTRTSGRPPARPARPARRSVARWPASRAAAATAYPILPLDRLLTNRTGSMASRVGPAVTSTFTRSARGQRAGDVAHTMSSSAARRPAPVSPQASSPVPGG